MDEFTGSHSPSSNNYAYLEDIHVAVPCNSSSDALLASLSVALNGDLNSTVLDAFLALLREPAFNPKDVTFEAMQNIFDHISEQRRRAAQARSFVAPKLLSDGVYGVVPGIVIDLVAQQLGHEMLPFADQIDTDINIYNADDVYCPRIPDLLSMTLVHRTWTDPVHRILRKRVKIVGSKKLRSFFCSPHMGPWLQEAYMVAPFDSIDVGEMLKLLVLFLRKTPNLKKLCIKTSWKLSGPCTFQVIVKELAQLPKLESLWLVPTRGHVASLPALCKVLPNLKSLKFLHIRNWMGGPGDGPSLHTELEQLYDNTSAGVQLTTLSFVDGAFEVMTYKFLSWLLRDNSSLKNLEVHTKDIGKLSDGSDSPLVRALQPKLHTIDALRLHYSAMNEDRGSTFKFVQNCSNLKKLSLKIGLHHELSYFPNTIEHLHVHFSTMWPVSGKYIHETLEKQGKPSNLKTLKLTKDRFREPGLDWDVEWDVADLERFCKEKDIYLSTSFSIPTFDELINNL